MTAIDSKIVALSRQAQLDTLPMLKENRRWGLLDFIWVQSGLAIATWAFLFGGVTAQFVGFWDGLWTMLLGNSIGVIVMIVASMLVTCKWGTEHFVIQRSIYGPVGVLILVLMLLTLVSVGWSTILAVMFGRAATEVVNDIAGSAFAPDSNLVVALAMTALAFAWWIVVRGDASVRALNRFVAPGLIVMSTILLGAIFTQRTVGEIVGAAPLAATGNGATDFMLAIELNVAAGVSWWTVAGNIGRGAMTQRAGVWGGFIGLVVVAVLAQMAGLTAALVLGSSDPTAWILPIAGPTLGIVLLVFLGLANLTSTANIIYAVCQALVQHLGVTVQALGWARLTGVLFGLCAALVLFTSTSLYDHFFTFVAWSQAAFVSAIGIVLADYYLLRRTRIDLRALYDLDAGGDYYYWGRVNYAALASLFVGISVFVALLNPATLVGSYSFAATSASLPAMVAALIAHIVLTRAVVIPAGKGGYHLRQDGR